MDDGLGISFAPTAEQSELGPKRGGMEGVPEAIKVLSLRLPRFLGARAPVNNALAQAPGAGGMDPYMSAVFTSLAKVLGAQGMMPGLEGGDGPMGGPMGATMGAPSAPPKPRIEFAERPGFAPTGGGDGPGLMRPALNRPDKADLLRPKML